MDVREGASAGGIFGAEKMMRILVIESDQALLSTLCEELEERGYSVDPATNGGEALRKLHSLPNIIVLDGILTDIDGLMFLAQIKSDQDLKNVPVIFLLESGDESKAHAAAELGVSKSVIKTHYGLSSLCDLIEKYLPQKKKIRYV